MSYDVRVSANGRHIWTRRTNSLLRAWFWAWRLRMGGWDVEIRRLYPPGPASQLNDNLQANFDAIAKHMDADE